MTEPDQDANLEEAKLQLFAAARKLVEAGFTLKPPPDIDFSVVKPNGWRRHQVVCTWDDHQVVVERFWSWDRAVDLANRLNEIRRSTS